MNRRTLIFLLLAVVVLGGAVLLVKERKGKSWSGANSRMGEKLVEDFPLNDVAHIEIVESTNQVNLVKTNDQWSVQERAFYPAAFSDISDLLRKVWEMKVAQPVPNIAASQLGRLDLTASSSSTNQPTLLVFKDKSGQTLNRLTLGKKHLKESASSSPYGGGSWPDGRYVMVDSNIASVALINEPLNNAEPKPQSWLDKDFFKVENIRAISVVATNETNSWAISRDTAAGEWKLAGLKPEETFDKTKVSSANYALSSPSFVDVAVQATPAQTGLDQARQVTITTFDNFTYHIKIGNKTPDDNYYFHVAVSADLPKERVAGKDEKAEDKAKLDKEFQEKQDKLKEKLKQESSLEPWNYLVSKWTVDFFLKDRKDLMAEKKEETKETKPATTSETQPSGSLNLVPPINPSVPLPPRPIVNNTITNTITSSSAAAVTNTAQPAAPATNAPAAAPEPSTNATPTAQPEPAKDNKTPPAESKPEQ